MAGALVVNALRSFGEIPKTILENLAAGGISEGISRFWIDLGRIPVGTSKENPERTPGNILKGTHLSESQKNSWSNYKRI